MKLWGCGERSVEHIFLRLLGIVILFIGIVTSALNVTFDGFAPIMWFLLAIVIFMITICTEVLRIADFLEEQTKTRGNIKNEV